MATTLHKAARGLTCLLVSGALPTLGQAQSQTARIQPTLDVQALSTNNAGLSSGGARQSDLILSATAGVSVMAKGANSLINGQWKLNAVNYTRGSQADRVLPSGLLTLHTDIMRQGIGLDASVAADQVQASFNNAGSTTPNTASSYTNTRYSLSPFVSRQLDGNTSLQARLNRNWLRSSENSSTLAARPNSSADNHQLLVTRRPTQMGYELEGNYQSTRVSGQPDPSLTQKTAKATLLYALNQELVLGIIGGRERMQVLTNTFDDTVRGARLEWRPGERTQLKAQIEDRHFGKGWQLDASHRAPWIALGFSSRRAPETYTSSLGTWQAGSSLADLYDAMLTTRITNPVDRKKAVQDLITSRNLPTTVGATRDAYDLGAVMRESTSGKLSIMGRRDVFTMAAGLTRSRPLLIDNNALQLPPSRTKEYFFDAQLNHRITPLSTITGGLRWTRAYNTPFDQAAVMSRDFSWLATLNTTLSPEAMATMGVRHQITHSPSTTSNDESSMFVGLGYRF